MHAFTVTAALLASTAAASSVGSAVVINKCKYDVYVCEVPAADGGYEESDQTLSYNETFTKEWTELSNGQGWSIKLSTSSVLNNIMQYEYTFHNDGTIWYDLSDVNGNPWEKNWEINASNPADDCEPKQQAYRYATDDAYGMQACSQDTTITVTLCSGESQDDDGAASASASAQGASSTASAIQSTASSAYSTPSSSLAEISTYAPSSSTQESSQGWHGFSWGSDGIVNEYQAPSATTFATSATVATEPNGVTVTEVATVVVTQVATATAYDKRDLRHRHHRHEAHA